MGGWKDKENRLRVEDVLMNWRSRVSEANRTRGKRFPSYLRNACLRTHAYMYMCMSICRTVL